MIQLLFTLAFAQMGLVLTLVFETPLRKLVIMGLNTMKQGRGPLVAKTVAGTLFVVFVSSLYSVMKIQKRSMDSGAVNPTDQVLLANHLLEASLMGFSLFFGLMIDRLHYYIKELHHLRTKEKSIKALEDEVLAARSKDKHLKSEPQTKLKKDRSPADKGASLGEIKNT